MKTALITTTINVPTVLALYRKLGPDVKFFIALDHKTPFKALSKWGFDANNSWLTPDFQKQWKCSELIGWNTDSRRNIALLEALKWGADLIISVDDDMIPYPGFFLHIENMLSMPYSGLCLGESQQWIDTGQFTIPPARQRGLPFVTQSVATPTHVHDVQIGAMQGIILGVPDTDASTTVVNRPCVLGATDILNRGFVVDRNAKAVFNSQLTAFRRELAPAFFQHYKMQGRNTDIIASVIMRRLMRDRNLYTYYGPPAGFHARTWRDPFKDMRAEQWGVENIDKLCDYFDQTDVIPNLIQGPAIPQLRAIWGDLKHSAWMPKEACECALAFLDDCESVL